MTILTQRSTEYQLLEHHVISVLFLYNVDARGRQAAGYSVVCSFGAAALPALFQTVVKIAAALFVRDSIVSRRRASVDVRIAPNSLPADRLFTGLLRGHVLVCMVRSSPQPL
jgi:hypothetical protein